MIDCFHYTAEDGIKIISKIKISYAVVKNAIVNGLKLILLFYIAVLLNGWHPNTDF